MRYRCAIAAALLVASIGSLVPLRAQGGSSGLSVTNYKFVSEE